MLTGVDATDGLELDKFTSAPPLGARLFSETVPVSEFHQLRPRDKQSATRALAHSSLRYSPARTASPIIISA